MGGSAAVIARHSVLGSDEMKMCNSLYERVFVEACDGEHTIRLYINSVSVVVVYGPRHGGLHPALLLFMAVTFLIRFSCLSVPWNAIALRVAPFISIHGCQKAR